MRIIKIINIFLSPNEKVIKEKLIPVLSYDLPIPDELPNLIVLSCKLYGTGIIKSTDNANDQYTNSREVINKLIKCNNITRANIHSI